MRVFFDSKLIYKTKTNANGQLFQMQLYFCSNKKTYLQHLQSQNVSMHFVKKNPIQKNFMTVAGLSKIYKRKGHPATDRGGPRGSG